MIDTTFRQMYQKLLVDPLLSVPIVNRLSPMFATGIGLFFGIVTGFLLAFQFSFAAFIALLISGYFDTLDGSLARRQGTSSPIGAVFDITSDRLVEFSVIFGLFCYSPLDRAAPSLLMLGSVLICITSFLVVGIFSENASEKGFHYSPGLMERTEAFAFFAVMIVWNEAFVPLAYLFSALVFFTALMRLLQFSRYTARKSHLG